MNKTLIIFDYMRTLYDPEQEVLIEGAKELLEKCVGRGYTLALVTQKEGHRAGQLAKLGIDTSFSHVYLVDEKQIAFDELRATYPSWKFFVIGDRVAGEILCGNRIGAKTIWFQNGAFADHVPQNEAETPDHVIENLYEAFDIIAA